MSITELSLNEIEAKSKDADESFAAVGKCFGASIVVFPLMVLWVPAAVYTGAKKIYWKDQLETAKALNRS
ncbi:hypothetical protein A3715_11390 [Oleiphilus sp. HI0009]|nr:hypothetical protein A3715_24130 [Oleiphilus sp. HI0009]KZX77310.1 hypothetical protein A3715_11390 [Oleiphilus sp. HI0009]